MSIHHPTFNPLMRIFLCLVLSLTLVTNSLGCGVEDVETDDSDKRFRGPSDNLTLGAITKRFLRQAEKPGLSLIMQKFGQSKTPVEKCEMCRSVTQAVYSLTPELLEDLVTFAAGGLAFGTGLCAKLIPASAAVAPATAGSSLPATAIACGSAIAFLGFLTKLGIHFTNIIGSKTFATGSCVENGFCSAESYGQMICDGTLKHGNWLIHYRAKGVDIHEKFINLTTVGHCRAASCGSGIGYGATKTWGSKTLILADSDTLPAATIGWDSKNQGLYLSHPQYGATIWHVISGKKRSTAASCRFVPSYIPCDRDGLIACARSAGGLGCVNSYCSKALKTKTICLREELKECIDTKKYNGGSGCATGSYKGKQICHKI